MLILNSVLTRVLAAGLALEVSSNALTVLAGRRWSIMRVLNSILTRMLMARFPVPLAGHPIV
jgi:hypothetical protein